MPANDEKLWYSLNEAASYLEIDEAVLQPKIIGHNLDEPRTLPGKKGRFLAKQDVLYLERMVKGLGLPRELNSIYGNV